jgi:hypothetical protein
MNADTITCDTGECTQFIAFWGQVTGAPHVTLTSIEPDGDAATRAFAAGDLDDATAWVAKYQERGWNIYFQPHETMPGCAKKPGKREMMAGTCRFADIDPVDDYPLADERDRLTRLAAHLISDTDYPPTAIIDSGNGMQPLWATAREVLSPNIIGRIEAETRNLEAALGAGGTHNIDRLLRLPGTINFPNSKKRKAGRGISRARLVCCRPVVYSAEQAAGLTARVAAHVAGTGLVRPKPVKTSTGATAGGTDGDVAALVASLTVAGADAISQPEHLPNELRTRLDAALAARPRLRDRWAGLVDDLTETGKDDSRSGAEMSLAAMLRAAGFANLDTAMVLCAFRHGKANGDEWGRNTIMRSRHVARSVLRSQPTDPRQKETARDALRLLRQGIPSGELLLILHRTNDRRGDPLPHNDINDTARWATRRLKEQATRV